MRNYRISTQEYKRMDYAERLSNFPAEFFHEFIDSITQEDLITYPSYEYYESIKKIIGDSIGFNSDDVYFNSGSDAVLKDIIQIMSEDGAEMLTTSPGFPMYEIYSKIFGIACKFYNYRGPTLSLDEFAEAITNKTKFVILANPNSPIGDWYNDIQIVSFLEHLKKRDIFLVLDEAYVEFAPSSMIHLLNSFENLVVVRTLSKAWGAAGIRFGYCVTKNKDLLSSLNKIQLTYPVSNITLKFAKIIFKRDDLVKTYVENTIKARNFLCNFLISNNYDVIESNTNTIHFHNKSNDIQSEVITELLSNGYSIKAGVLSTATAVRIPGDSRNTWIRLSLGGGIEKDDVLLKILSRSS